jgi:hypothetical protein
MGRCLYVYARDKAILRVVNDKPFTLAVFRVEAANVAAFKTAWTDLCTAFLRLPAPPAGPMTLIQSAEDPRVFQSLGPWRSTRDIEAMRADPEIMPLMNAMVALCAEAKPGMFNVLEVVPNQTES